MASRRSATKKSVRLMEYSDVSDNAGFAMSPLRQQQQLLLMQQSPTSTQKRSVGFLDQSDSVESAGQSLRGDDGSAVGFSTRLISFKYSGAFSPVNQNIQKKRAAVLAAAASAKSCPMTPAPHQQVHAEEVNGTTGPAPLRNGGGGGGGAGARRGGLLTMGARAMVPGSRIDAEAAAAIEAELKRKG